MAICWKLGWKLQPIIFIAAPFAPSLGLLQNQVYSALVGSRRYYPINAMIGNGYGGRLNFDFYGRNGDFGMGFSQFIDAVECVLNKFADYVPLVWIEATT
jgi:hypothetical protein